MAEEYRYAMAGVVEGRVQHPATFGRCRQFALGLLAPGRRCAIGPNPIFAS